MHVLLICPTTRPAVPALTRQRPLALTPCLGRTPLEHALTALADRHVVIEKGRVVWTGTNDEFLADHSITDRYLHL